MTAKMTWKAGVALALALSVTACQTTSNTNRTASASRQPYCEERPEVCILVGGLIFGGVVALVASSGGGNAAAPGAAPVVVIPPPVVVPGGPAVGVLSDRRLKHDIVPVETLANGLKTYAFKYNGDDHWFVGVMAQDLLADARFRFAVKEMPNGYLAVDYKSLGLSIVNVKAMQSAGQAALDRL